jgi:hypothetical protein
MLSFRAAAAEPIPRPYSRTGKDVRSLTGLRNDIPFGFSVPAASSVDCRVLVKAGNWQLTTARDHRTEVSISASAGISTLPAGTKVERKASR